MGIIATKFVAILPDIATNVIFHPIVAILGSIATNLVAIMRVMTTRMVADNGARGVITWSIGTMTIGKPHPTL